MASLFRTIVLQIQSLEINFYPEFGLYPLRNPAPRLLIRKEVKSNNPSRPQHARYQSDLLASTTTEADDGAKIAYERAYLAEKDLICKAFLTETNDVRFVNFVSRHSNRAKPMFDETSLQRVFKRVEPRPDPALQCS